jgi:hypothetical protein
MPAMNFLKPHRAGTAPAQHDRRIRDGARGLAIMLSLLAATTSSAQSADESGSSAAWQAARDAYARQHFFTAIQALEQLAKQGDVRAAELVGQMLFFGERVYGTAVPRDVKRAQHWLTQAAEGGSTIAAFLLDQARAATQPSGSPAAVQPADEPYVPGPHGC